MSLSLMVVIVSVFGSSACMCLGRGWVRRVGAWWFLLLMVVGGAMTLLGGCSQW